MFVVFCSCNFVSHFFPGIYLRRNFPVTDGKELSLTIDTVL